MRTYLAARCFYSCISCYCIVIAQNGFVCLMCRWVATHSLICELLQRQLQRPLLQQLHDVLSRLLISKQPPAVRQRGHWPGFCCTVTGTYLVISRSVWPCQLQRLIGIPIERTQTADDDRTIPQVSESENLKGTNITVSHDLTIRTKIYLIAALKLFKVNVNQSINQSKHIFIAPYVENESEAHNVKDYRLSVHVYSSWQHQTVQFLSYA